MSDLVQRLRAGKAGFVPDVQTEAADRLEDADQVIKTLQAAGRMYLEGIIRRDQYKRDLRLAEKRIEALETALQQIATFDFKQVARRALEGK